MKLYFASGNEHKKKEMSRLLGGFSLTLPKEEGIVFDPDENGSTFIENAIIKAKALYSIVKEPVLSDDSGLCVKALSGKPGILKIWKMLRIEAQHLYVLFAFIYRQNASMSFKKNAREKLLLSQ